LKATAADRQLKIGTAVFQLNVACDGDVTFGLRPEDIRLVAPDSAHLTSEIVSVEPMGREVFYTLDTPAGTIHALEYGEAVRHAPGDKVGMTCETELTLLFDAAGKRINDLHAVISSSSNVRAKVLETAN
jgi:inositol-phosphate transport system ATP-binding protein